MECKNRVVDAMVVSGSMLVLGVLLLYLAPWRQVCWYLVVMRHNDNGLPLVCLAQQYVILFTFKMNIFGT